MNRKTSKDAIKDALKRHKGGAPPAAEIVEALRSEGIDTITKLVERQLAFRKTEHRLSQDRAILAGGR